ncbi:2-octaprenyl-6-methoxyphenyl hydroxylase [Aliiglaciecola sp. CAU 1673]|uniref:2-octaprenyl-6-methoxyphenyl hydroxylase n=1 Tax=Aliiglaciecola sp. CAU 1673 TaxID=3032595 RepID=UPI0023DC4209|nr:2-octaprenyl-6-methoxyphenyl hydroxylase [Aliiglaciecola sp. CAU 1673]MDF2179454.1 2-octaprenyl-6-methoxyphenyl hydroxylase [Aliiglaciecola sp. CAU 1673]
MDGTAPINQDLVIVGGGTIGSLLALALADAGLKITVIEAKAYQASQNHPSFDGRTIALAYHSAQYLAKLGLSLDSSRYTPIRHIKVSDKGHLGQCSLDAKRLDVDALGLVVSQQQLGEDLHQALSGKAITWHCPDRVVSVEQQQEKVVLTLASGQTLHSRLLVIADGGDSPTAKLLGIQSRIQDYGQAALVANVEMDRPHQYVAHERFTPSGPLAILPLSERYGGLVWSLHADELDAYLQLDDVTFLQRLQQAFGYGLGRFVRVGIRAGYPLRLVTVGQSVHHRTVLLGNAAHTLHPIAGQGFNLGLRDVEALANLLQSGAQEEDIGRFQLLHRYHRQRIGDQQQVIGLTDTLVKTFSNDFLPLVVGRNLGLTLMSRCGPLSDGLAWRAMGKSAKEKSVAKL